MPGQKNYKHLQTGWVVILACLLVLVLFGLLLERKSPRINIAPLVMLLQLAIIMFMGALIVEVDDTTIRVTFGVGLVRKTITLADIESCRPVRNSWWAGWGIRRLHNGWLYNVSGFQAVELVTKNGRIFRIGTDEPKALCDFISAKLEKAADVKPA